MDRCKTCKHWLRTTVSIPNGGICTLISRPWGHGYTISGTLAEIMPHAESVGGREIPQLATHEQFGCPHHEPKPPEKPQ